MFGVHRFGKNNPRFGKKHSEKTKELIIKNHADVKGENNPLSKLTKNDIIEIRHDSKSRNLTQKQIADKFNVCISLISQIKLRKIWKHIKDNQKDETSHQTI